MPDRLDDSAHPTTADPARPSTGRLMPGKGGSPGVNRLAALAAQLLQVRAAVVSLRANDGVMHVAGTAGVTPDDAHTILCSRVAESERPLVVSDTHTDARTAPLPAHVGDDVGTYLGVPLQGDSRLTIGTLCVYDENSRTWTSEHVRILEQLAAAAATELELAALTREYELDRARWDVAISAAGIGNFDWNLTTGQLQWDQPLIELFGYDGDEKFDESIDAFNARVHPDDVADVTLKLQTAIDTVGLFEAEYRIVLPGGRIRRVQARGQASGAGMIADRVAGSAWDVSRTRGAGERAENILQAMPVGYVALDDDLAVTTINAAAERLLQVRRTEVTGRSLWNVVPHQTAESLAEHCRAVRRADYSVEVELYVGDPIAAWLEIRIWPEASGTGLYLTDVTERREAEELTRQLAEYDRMTAVSLQDAMLTELPQLDHLEIRARYRAAAARNKVGGDWYDAVVQSGGATALMVGDVTGHDIRAAAVMGQLRSMLRVLAWQGDDRPETVLDTLDRAIAALHQRVFATAVVARIEQTAEQAVSGNRTLRWCSAGHPPPVLVAPDGDVTALDARGIMLGVRAGDNRQEFTAELPEGSTLLLYTDGLIERRGTTLDDGIERLCAAARRHRELTTDAFVDAVLGDLLDDDADDDVVLLALRVHPAD